MTFEGSAVCVGDPREVTSVVYTTKDAIVFPVLCEAATSKDVMSGAMLIVVVDLEAMRRLECEETSRSDRIMYIRNRKEVHASSRSWRHGLPENFTDPSAT